jgi:hypothetical protein
MKLIKIASGLIVMGFIGFFYLYIPTTLKISTYKISKVHELSAIRLLNDKKLLLKCLSIYHNPTSNQLTLNGIDFKLNPGLSNVIGVDINSKNIKTQSFISVSPVNNKTTVINWFLEFKTNWNPIQRLKDYNEAVEIKKATSQILNTINDFVEKPLNVYGYDIKEVTLSDTVLVTTKFISKSHPSNQQIYTAVDALNNYLKKFDRNVLNNPMITILENPTKDFTVMVGISIDGTIPETDKFSIKRMPVNGKMFVTEVTGGSLAIQNGYSALKNYLLDAKRPSPAVPFELLMNNRRQIIDSTKWQTRLYYPVM